MTPLGTLPSREVSAADRPGRPAGKRFRGDIQGLRALAVLLVVLSHAGVPQLRGGYVGVDVFFVISGFVITGSLLSGEHRKGISLSAFYAARARRILPMSTLVLVATVLASAHLLNFVRAGRVVTDTIWAGFFAANFHFSAQGTDYFAADLPQSPLQHYWSLAVEEQFYLVWPLLLGLLIFGLTRASRRRAARAPMPTPRVAAFLAWVIAASLIWSIVQTAELPGAAFFSTLTRVWELAVGALLAVGAATVTRLPAVARPLLSWTGLAGIVTAAVVFTAGTPFPGAAALLPVLSTAAVIAAGTGPPSRVGAGRLLALQPFRAVGDCSYSFYLWHWPILIIAAAYAGRGLSLTANLALLAGALALSFLTYRFVETPFRRAKWLQRERSSSLVLWPAAVVVLLWAVVWTTTGLRAQADQRAASAEPPTDTPSAAPTSSAVRADDPSAAVRAAVAAARAGKPIPADLAPPVDRLAKDVEGLGGCVAQAGQTSSKLCTYGDRSAKRSIAVLGDSHAMMWLPALDAIGKKYGWSVRPVGKYGCTAVNLTLKLPGGQPDQECDKWRAWALSSIGGLHPDRVIVADAMAGAAVDKGRGEITNSKTIELVAQKWRAAISSTAQTLAASGAHVTVLSDPPLMKDDPTECLLRRKATMATCTSTLSSFKKRVNGAASEAAAVIGTDFADLGSWFCADDQCPLVIGSTVAFRDRGHITRTYSLHLADAMADKLGLSGAGDPRAAVEAAVRDAKAKRPVPTNVAPAVDKISQDGPRVDNKCIAFDGQSSHKLCKYGDLTAKRSLVIIGDSHAEMWIPAFDAIGKKDGLIVYPFGKLGCPYASLTPYRKARDRQCETWRSWALERIKALRPDRIIMTNLLHGDVANSDGSRVVGTEPLARRWRDAITATAKDLRATGAKVSILSDPPGMKDDPTECLLRRNATMATCTSPLDPLGARLNQAAQEAAAAAGVGFADLTTWFCADGQCPTVIGSIVAHRDRDQLSRTYALHLAEPLAQTLRLTAQ